MRIFSSIIVAVVLMALSGCSAARSGLGGLIDVDGGGLYAVDGDTLPDFGQACPPEGCVEMDGGTPDVDAGTTGMDAGGLVDTGMPAEDAGVDSGMIVMGDSGSPDAGTPDAGLPSCPSPGVYSAVTGRCYRYLGPDSALTGVTCATLGMEAVWWSTTAEEDAIRALPGMFPIGGDATDLNCPNYWISECTHGEYTWTHHPGVTPMVTWTAGTRASGTGAGLNPDGMHAFTGGAVAGGGFLCQSL